MQLIVEGIPNLNGFIYGSPFEINNYREKQYPLLLVDHNVNIDGLNLKTNQRVYTFKLFFYDLYSRKQITQRSTHDKQLDIEVLGESFLKLFRWYCRNAGYHWAIENDENISGFWAYHKNNDKLIQLVYTLKVRASGGCDDAYLGIALKFISNSPYFTIAVDSSAQG